MKITRKPYCISTPRTNLFYEDLRNVDGVIILFFAPWHCFNVVKFGSITI